MDNHRAGRLGCHNHYPNATQRNFPTSETLAAYRLGASTSLLIPWKQKNTRRPDMAVYICSIAVVPNQALLYVPIDRAPDVAVYMRLA